MNVELNAAELVDELLGVLEKHPDLGERLRALLTTSEPPRRLYETAQQAAERFGVSRRTVFAWLAAGLPSVGAGRTRRVDVARALEWLRARGQADSAIEARARRDATRAARRVG